MKWVENQMVENHMQDYCIPRLRTNYKLNVQSKQEEVGRYI